MHHRGVEREPILTPEQRAFLGGARRAVLATIDPQGQPRLVPICHVVGDDDKLGRPRLYTPIDDKPKATQDAKNLSRIRDLLILPAATILADRWDEDWTRLGWLRVYGRAEILEPQPHEAEEHAWAVAALREKYPQYATHRLEEHPIIRVAIDRARAWGDLSSPDG
jgi:coenzyme F420-0:L-glutamate ligase / coenzyme F420-1:gamma-L-glutamate ligase